MQEKTEHASAAMDDLGRIRKEVADAVRAAATVMSGERRTRQRTLAQEVDELLPVMTVVGQMKAGKTAVINALLRRPGFLPSHVNPWTSAVTSVRCHVPGSENRAVFEFLGRGDWAALSAGGGPLGEIARRAGFPEQSARIAAQAERVRARAAERLGPDFDRFLDRSHVFNEVSPALVARYVAGGDGPSNASVGLYAELTKRADVTLGAEGPGLPRIIRDTPGVNDPLLLRENATLEALRDTDVSIVALNAGQAMTTSDLGLIRILFAIRAESLIVFVNRTDELSDPEGQVDAIRERIGATLEHYGIDATPPVIMGSAAWAEAALLGDLGRLPDGSRALLERVARTEGLNPLTAAWRRSGIVALETAISRVLGEGLVRRKLGHALRLTLSMLRAESDRAATRAPDGPRPNARQVADRLDRIVQRRTADLDRAIDAHAMGFKREFQDVVETFIAEETRALEASASETIWLQGWTGNGARLRRLLSRLYYRSLDEQTERLQKVFQTTARDLVQVHADLSGGAAEDLVAPPQVPEPGAPVAIGATLAIDVGGRWWYGWGAARASRVSQELAAVIRREGKAIIDRLETENRLAQAVAVRKEFGRFLASECTPLIELAQGVRPATPPPVGQPAIERRVLAALASLTDGPAKDDIAAQ
ncbi:MAG: dynamin family protein [Pseudomonadota bacterium]